jgi:hypothetical protein
MTRNFFADQSQEKGPIKNHSKIPFLVSISELGDYNLVSSSE